MSDTLDYDVFARGPRPHGPIPDMYLMDPIPRTPWRPIATAPRNGTRIDVWMGNAEHPGRIPDAYWGRPHHTCGEAGPYCDGCPPDADTWCDQFGAIADTDGDPTHWMPTPEPPAV